MTFLDAFALGAIQGVTEFLPISSSGHLIIFENFLSLPAYDLLAFDVALHVATLIAILIYFWNDIKGLFQGIPKLLKGQWSDSYVKLILFIIIATIPAALAGLFFGDYIDLYFRDTKTVATWFLFIGCFFILGEFLYKKSKNKIPDIQKWYHALTIGIVQAFALIPGISRSGSTIVTGLFLGIPREKAARFSFLIGIPAIAGAGLLTAIDTPETAVTMPLPVLAVGFISSFTFSLLTVWALMKFIKKHSFAWFSIYLFIAGLAIIFEIF